MIKRFQITFEIHDIIIMYTFIYEEKCFNKTGFMKLLVEVLYSNIGASFVCLFDKVLSSIHVKCILYIILMYDYFQ